MIKQGTLLRDDDAVALAVVPNQHFDHVSDGAVLAIGSRSEPFLQARFDTKGQRGGFGLGHGFLDPAFALRIYCNVQ